VIPVHETKVTMYMRWYVGDYLNDTDHLSLPEHGAYSLLLMKLWQRDGWLPLDHDQLARLCRVSREAWDEIWPAVSGYFLVAEGGGFFTQKRLLEELEKAKMRCEVAARSGALGGRTRAAKASTQPGTRKRPLKGRQSNRSSTAQATLEAPLEQPLSDAQATLQGSLKQTPKQPSSRFQAGQGSGVRESPPARAPDPRRRGTCTGYDLEQWYGEERAEAVEGALPWKTPRSTDGKAEEFAASLSPEEVADVRPTMKLHFAELKAGKGKAGALENPTFGFGCWRSDFTKLRERLHGKTPTAGAIPVSTLPRVGATDEAKAQVAAMIASLEARNGA
jgi:uncharacterized protein YdaU (DUF1376 family)